MPHLEAAGGARLHYHDEGTGPLIILVHGGTGTGAYDWEHQRGPLSASHRVITPDLRGHGASSDPQWLLSIPQIGLDTLALIDELGERPAAIISFSIGASAMLHLLCERPGITDAFVAIGASRVGRPQDVASITAGPWPGELRALVHEHGEDEEHWQRLRRRLAQTWADDMDLGDDDIRRVEIPSLVVCGDRDVIEPVEVALGLARTLPAGELLVVPRSGHFVSRERPAELNAALEGFLGRHINQEEER